MIVTPLGLRGVLRIDADVYLDDRGFLTEVHRSERYEAHGVGPVFVQDNHARSRGGALRGLHWQLKQPQGKLVSVVRGRIWDVVVDVRPDSPTHRRWVAETLSPGTQLWIPPGYAHGFCVLSNEADVLYKNTAPYLPEEGRGVRWDDPALGIDWPIDAPILSTKDAALPTLATIDPADLP